jgi:hypothetical protein
MQPDTGVLKYGFRNLITDSFKRSGAVRGWFYAWFSPSELTQILKEVHAHPKLLGEFLTTVFPTMKTNLDLVPASELIIIPTHLTEPDDIKKNIEVIAL